MEYVFLVEDDENFGSVLSAYLEMNDYEVRWVKDGKNAIDTYKPGKYNICVLDVMLPHVDGFEVARAIRERDKEVPLIFLTAKSLKEDMVTGFQIGADDYITKPFDSEVLLYKIQAILKRESKKSEKTLPREYPLGQYIFDYHLRKLKREGEERKLSPKEADLLHILCKHKNEVLPRQEALKTVWGDDSYFTGRSMDVYITKLRKYLKADPNLQIENIHGSGYRLLINEG